MKKVKVLGKMIPVFVLVLLGLGMVSAVVVNYLSNQVEADVEVKSPFEAGIATGNQVNPSMPTSEAVTLTALYGGDTIRVTTGFHYLGSETMSVTEKYTISNAGISCDDFESIKWTTCTAGCSVFDTVWQTLPTGICTQVDYNNIEILYPNTYDSGEYNVNNFALKLKPAALGNYTFSAQVVPV